jgi:hypothetical protein
MFVGTDRLWRLRSGEGDVYHARFWGQTIQFLTLSRLLGENRRIRLTVAPAQIPLGASVDLYAHMVDELYQPLAAPAFRVEVAALDHQSEAETVQLQPVPDAEGLHHAVLVPRRSGRYQIAAGEADRPHANTVQLTVNARAGEQVDVAVRLVFPAEDAKATLNREMKLTFSATDDRGLARAWIVFSLNAGREQRREIGDLLGKAPVQRQVPWPIRESIRDLRLGDIVTYAIEVADGRPSDNGARRARSRSRRVQFVSDDEYLRYLLARTRRTLGQLRPLYLQQREAAELIRKVGFQDGANSRGLDDP